MIQPEFHRHLTDIKASTFGTTFNIVFRNHRRWSTEVLRRQRRDITFVFRGPLVSGGAHQAKLYLYTTTNPIVVSSLRVQGDTMAPICPFSAILSKSNAIAYPIVFLLDLTKWCESLPLKEEKLEHLYGDSNWIWTSVSDELQSTTSRRIAAFLLNHSSWCFHQECFILWCGRPGSNRHATKLRIGFSYYSMSPWPNTSICCSLDSIFTILRVAT